MTLTIIDGMTSLGWSLGGGPGSVKKNSDGWVIARNLDQDWQADIAKVIAETAKENGFYSLGSRCRLAWDVFLGRAVRIHRRHTDLIGAFIEYTRFLGGIF